MSSRLAAAVRVALPDPEIYYSGEDLLAVANKIHAMGPDVDMPDIWDTICTEALRDAEDRPAELDPEGGVCPDCGISHYRGIISNARETVNEARREGDWYVHSPISMAESNEVFQRAAAEHRAGVAALADREPCPVILIRRR